MMNQIKTAYFFYITVIGLAAVLLSGCSRSESPERINIANALSSVSDPGCFSVAQSPANIRFPEDNGPHEAFQTEWWYYTGNLKTKGHRQFGFQLTIFRQALSCEPLKKGSKWRTRQIYFAHLGLTDVSNTVFYAGQRMNRESIGIAGSRAVPFKVWIDDWEIMQTGKTMRLYAAEDPVSFELSLSKLSQPVLQGNRGLSRKGAHPSNASYYYSIPRIETNRVITIGAESFEVEGLTWFDHEWSTSALDSDVSGWDWFAVHLDDGRDLMVCRIRNKSGNGNGFGFGSLSFPDGRFEILKEQDFSVRPLSTWESPLTQKIYPHKWQITIPEKGIDLSVTPLIPNQEHTHSLSYWEGAARFKGEQIQGLGYIELTGY